MVAKDVWIKGIGQKRGAPHITLDSAQAVRAGFAPGERFELDVDGQRVVIKKSVDGSRKVSRRLRGDKELPVIDINNREDLAIFAGMDAVRVVVTDGAVYLLPLASQARQKERFNRLATKLAAGDTLVMGSLSHGGGILSHAIHSGLKKAGLEVELAFANEIRDDLLEHAREHNDAWAQKTAALALPMQEIHQDEWLMRTLPLVDILEMGLPCSGASKAGVSKRKLAMMEEHEQVGHLVYSALAILERVQPSVMLLENVPDYARTASAQILRFQLRDMGYKTHERIVAGRDFGALEDRVRWCMVAVTNGVDFEFEKMMPQLRVVGTVQDIIDPSVSPDDPAWRVVSYLKDKQSRDAQAGNNFKMQFVDLSSSSVPTLRKGYHKGGSTDVRLRHPQNPELSRLFNEREHARAKGVPTHLIEGLSSTTAHQVLGQGIVYDPFVAVGRHVGQALQELREMLEALAEAKGRSVEPGSAVVDYWAGVGVTVRGNRAEAEGGDERGDALPRRERYVG